mgnify:CR=1 FL=1
MPSRTWSTEGEANTMPQTAAVRPPFPTKPAWAGSCPEPPPEMSATRSWHQSERTMTVPEPPGTSATGDGLCITKPSSDSFTIPEASL